MAVNLLCDQNEMKITIIIAERLIGESSYLYRMLKVNILI